MVYLYIFSVKLTRRNPKRDEQAFPSDIVSKQIEKFNEIESQIFEFSDEGFSNGTSSCVGSEYEKFSFGAQ